MLLPPTVAPAQRDTVRLIVAGRIEAVLLPLAADPEALDDLSGVEGFLWPFSRPPLC